MLQNLLAERLHLTPHRETKDLPIYTPVAGPGANFMMITPNGVCMIA